MKTVKHTKFRSIKIVPTEETTTERLFRIVDTKVLFHLYVTGGTKLQRVVVRSF